MTSIDGVIDKASSTPHHTPPIPIARSPETTQSRRNNKTECPRKQTDDDDVIKWNALIM